MSCASSGPLRSVILDNVTFGRFRFRLLSLTSGLIACGAMAASDPAWAASSRRAAIIETNLTAKPSTAPPTLAVVSISDQKITLWSADGLLARSPVSTGMIGHRTPTGVFSVIGKERYHESNLYSSAPMPFMQRITWSGIALHAGNLPGYAASHGCIRLPDEFAQRLYGMTRMGMRVVIADRELAPVAMAHASLPAPTFVRESQFANTGVGVVVPDGRMRLGGPNEAAGKLLNPMERGKLEQGLTKHALLEAEADSQALLEIAQIRGHEAKTAADALRAIEGSLKALVAGRDKAREDADKPSLAEDERTRAGLARAALDVAYSVAIARRAAAASEAERADAAAFHAAAEAKAAVAERDVLEHSARVATRATEPISVFVSRKNHRVYVRQGFEPVFEADVDILDPLAPLGTHVFTAVEAPADTGALRWTALTIPDAGRADSTPARTQKSPPGVQKAVLANVRETALPATAVNALDRVKFSDEVLQKISEKLWTGASIIISDYGVSHETGKGTDFVILTRSSSGD